MCVTLSGIVRRWRRGGMLEERLCRSAQMASKGTVIEKGRSAAAGLRSSLGRMPPRFTPTSTSTAVMVVVAAQGACLKALRLPRGR